MTKTSKSAIRPDHPDYDPQEGWFSEGYSNDPATCHHSFGTALGDVEYIGEPHYGYGTTWQCDGCGLVETIYDEALTKEMCEQQFAEEDPAPTMLLGFPEPPKHIRPSFGNHDTAARALEDRLVVCALKLRGNRDDGVVMMLSGDRGEVLAFAKTCKRFYSLVTDPKGLR